MNFLPKGEIRYLLENQPKRKKILHAARLDNDEASEREEPNPFTLAKPTGEDVLIIRKTTTEEEKENGDE